MWLSRSEWTGGVIGYGDTVVVYVGHERMSVLCVTAGAVLQCKFGAIRHDSLVGQSFGRRHECAKGFVYLLKGTPELWTTCLPHRTQILYFADVSLLVSGLEVRAGSRVVEAGTGSGSLTHSLARNVQPHGRVFSFDFHAQRVADASDELSRHGLHHVVRCECRDVCTAGFPDDVRGVDAVFLDLPHPWLVIPAAKLLLRSGARIASFSPCIEQVHKTHAALRQHLFHDLTTCETLLRPVATVKHTTLSPLHPPHSLTHTLTDALTDTQYTVAHPSPQLAGHTGFLTFATRL